jgi:hypothetical protein
MVFSYQYEVRNTFVELPEEEVEKDALWEVEYSETRSCPGDFISVVPEDGLAPEDDVVHYKVIGGCEDFECDLWSKSDEYEMPNDDARHGLVDIGRKVWYREVEPGYVCDARRGKLLVRFRDGKYWIAHGHWSFHHRDTASRVKHNPQRRSMTLQRRPVAKAHGLPGRGDLRKANQKAQSDATASQAVHLS